ncbi:YjcQ family protein [Phaeovulum sp. NW3]|uniref:YjcQ family protein n=1 Tax=Phaeovulum sp. NW3 TaxID=2934933 RepID=UPI0020229B36|nr:YjcQ family protein [Phaeovulum sp. NW3]MCL7463778.1 YjcQ family protein [Phaeovulum sp. NW3]
MTVSRIEAELSLLEIIASGDGEFVEVDDLHERDVLILKDLREAGYIRGVTYSLGASYRITASGERYLSQLQKELAELEKPAVSTAGKRGILATIGANKARLVTIGATLIGGVWFLFTQVLAPSWICPKLPNWLSAMAGQCEKFHIGAPQ